MQKPIFSKIVTLGDYAVGKSSLIQRFTKNDFTDTRTQTVGAEFSPKQILRDGRLIELQIWDTAGQEVYRSIAKLYYKDANFAIIVYDVTKPKSFEVLKFWLEKLFEEGLSDITKFIIANKIDLESQVPLEEVKQYANSFDPKIQVFETSCKQNIGVFELFNHIADLVNEKEKQQQQQKREEKPAIKIVSSENRNDSENSCC
ncbi:unnamed protein product [Paramecium octaurelia]|uniref:Uncharacterized protein n=1 Tax=Paramecium octaurelia TaxID=43137 RepID=A0A8S1S782_PAROT|nr:unnamed protein product [Paramecium octaurelia]